MIAEAESTIAGAELSIGGGGEGHPKSIQIDTNGTIVGIHTFDATYLLVSSQ